MGVQCFAGEAPFLFMSGMFFKKTIFIYDLISIFIIRMVYKDTGSCLYDDDDIIGHGHSFTVLLFPHQSVVHSSY